MQKSILVTGGAGYVGSHCILPLLAENYKISIFDNLSTGHIETINSLKKYGDIDFINGDLTKISDIRAVFDKRHIDCVFHFAAFSQVGESFKDPQKYYNNNISGTLNLLKVMIEKDVKKFIFSSTAAVYGEPEYIPIDENHPLKPINPYGRTKLMIENILDDYDTAYGLKSVRLRYFNVAGADSLCRIGEWHEPETHLIPNILKSEKSNDHRFELYGTDYPTKDGTCIRDYINVEDLANAHLLALKYLEKTEITNCFNIGTKTGCSVREIFDICKSVTGKDIPVEIKPKREGDPVVLVADNSKAADILGWLPQKTLIESIQTAYNWECSLNSISNVKRENVILK